MAPSSPRCTGAKKTGQGGEVRASLLASGMWANNFLIQASLCGAAVPPRPPREETTHALGGTYRTEDGRWFLLALTSEARQWPALATAIGQPTCSPIRASPTPPRAGRTPLR